MNYFVLENGSFSSEKIHDGDDHNDDCGSGGGGKSCYTRVTLVMVVVEVEDCDQVVLRRDMRGWEWNDQMSML